jgi:hypothetical protein
MFLLLFLSYSEKNKTVFYRVKEPNHEQTESGHLDTPDQAQNLGYRRKPGQFEPFDQSPPGRQP